jgi:hypothetical protein
MKEQFESDGYVLVKGLFSPAEAEVILAHFMEVHRSTGEYCEGGVDPTSDDPLRRFPRMMNPHTGDAVARDYFLDSRIRQVLNDITGADPYAVQTMVYFKPAGSRGQALHQDQRYLHVRPGTCVAAWMALDRCDPDNGGLRVVPGSHTYPILCPIKSDTGVSFTHETVPVPEGKEVVNVIMDPGDVLFFHGNLIHGSDPNRTTDRFRRIIVGHSAVAEMEVIGRWYNDALTMDGQPIQLEGIDGDGPCGTFVTRDGEQLIDMSETLSAALAAH